MLSQETFEVNHCNGQRYGQSRTLRTKPFLFCSETVLIDT